MTAEDSVLTDAMIDLLDRAPNPIAAIRAAMTRVGTVDCTTHASTT